jgi:hypothetical protein
MRLSLFATQREFSAYGPVALGRHRCVRGWRRASGVCFGLRQIESQARRFGRILGAVTAAMYGSILAYSLTFLGFWAVHCRGDQRLSGPPFKSKSNNSSSPTTGAWFTWGRSWYRPADGMGLRGSAIGQICDLRVGPWANEQPCVDRFVHPFERDVRESRPGGEHATDVGVSSSARSSETPGEPSRTAGMNPGRSSDIAQSKAVALQHHRVGQWGSALVALSANPYNHQRDDTNGPQVRSGDPAGDWRDELRVPQRTMHTDRINTDADQVKIQHLRELPKAAWEPGVATSWRQAHGICQCAKRSTLQRI